MQTVALAWAAVMAHAGGERPPRRGSAARQCRSRAVARRGALSLALGTTVLGLQTAGQGTPCERGAGVGVGACLMGVAVASPAKGDVRPLEAPAATVCPRCSRQQRCTILMFMEAIPKLRTQKGTSPTIWKSPI